MQNQKGVALLQVLLMSAVISVLALQMSYSAKDKVQVAQSFQDRVLAQVNLHTLESELYFELATKRWSKDATSESISSNWNFRGQKFIFGSSQISIQDNEGLLSLFNGGNKNLIEPILASLVGGEHKARVARNKLIDMQGYRRAESSSAAQGQFFQSRYELTEALKDLGIASNKTNIFTRIPGSAFRPLQAPDDVLNLWLSKREASAVIEARNLNELTATRFTQITGKEKSDDLLFIPSGKFIIEMTSDYGNARARKHIFINVSPLSTRQPFWNIGVKG